MPKPRKGGPAQCLLSVSPWHDRAADKRSNPALAAPGEEAYSVVDLPLISPGPLASGPAAEPSAAEGSAAPSSAPQQPANNEAAAAASDSLPWKVKKRKTDVDGAPAEQPLHHISEGGSTEPSDADQAPVISTAAPEDVMEGMGVLAVLPNNSITGHFLPHGERRRSIGLMGQEVLAYRDCTRDAEWHVLRMTAIDFGGGREAAFLVERTEGDAMTLRAPIAWQGAEASTMEELSRGCHLSMGLEFDCQQLLVEAAAEAELRRVQPSLCGRGALVNVGSLRLTWPQHPSEPGGSGVGGAAPQATRAAQRQTGGVKLQALTSGPGSGRTVRDSEDLW